MNSKLISILNSCGKSIGFWVLGMGVILFLDHVPDAISNGKHIEFKCIKDILLLVITQNVMLIGAFLYLRSLIIERTNQSEKKTEDLPLSSSDGKTPE